MQLLYCVFNVFPIFTIVQPPPMMIFFYIIAVTTSHFTILPGWHVYPGYCFGFTSTFHVLTSLETFCWFWDFSRHELGITFLRIIPSTIKRCFRKKKHKLFSQCSKKSQDKRQYQRNNDILFNMTSCPECPEFSINNKSTLRSFIVIL